MLYHFGAAARRARSHAHVMLLAAVFLISLAASVVVFLLMGFDKRRSHRGGRRVPEATLHLFELLGGWPGSLLASRIFRHKTRKRSYRIAFWLCAAGHLSVSLLLLR